MSPDQGSLDTDPIGWGKTPDSGVTPEQADILRAWLEEKPFQIKDSLGNWYDANPADVYFAVREQLPFRLKPEPKIVRFRLAAKGDEGGPWIQPVYDDAGASYLAKTRHFLGWAGTWQSVDMSTLTKD